MPVKTKKQNRLESNTAELRKILTVDTLIEEVNQEEALEFLDAVEENFATKQQELDEALADAEKEIKILEKDIEKKDKEIEELKEEAEDWEPKARRAGFRMVRVETMQQEMLLEEFVNTQLWPNYNQQKDNVII